jgi:thioredoxin 1
MSKKYDSYATFSGYNNESKNDKGPYKKYGEINNEAPKLPTQGPPQGMPQQGMPQGPQQGMSQGVAKQNMLPSAGAQPRSEQPKVREIEGPKLFNLLTDKKYATTKNGSPTKVMVKVYTDWCGPCKKVAPKFEEIAWDPKYSDILFVKVNADNMGKELKDLLNVGAVPVFFGFISGQKMAMVPGADINKIIETCNELASYK